MPKSKTLTSSSVRAGTKPSKPSPKLPRGTFDLCHKDEWQARCYERLRGSLLWRIKAPTGSGKSTTMKALSVALVKKKGDRVIISVPQEIIGQSFNSDSETTIILPDRSRVVWKADIVLIDTSQTKSTALIDFLESETGGILLCTHQTLMAADNKMVREGRRDLWKKTHLIIDEAHHLVTDKIDGSTPTDDGNRLGSLMNWWVGNNRSRSLGLVSATWMRRDLRRILPQRGSFNTFEYPIDEYLEGMTHLRDIFIRFVTDTHTRALRSALKVGSKVIAYLPPTGSRHASGLGTKGEILNEMLSSIGPWETSGPYRIHRNGRKNVRSVDLVDDSDLRMRRVRKDALIADIKVGNEPDVVLALNMGQEGYDQPSLDHAVLIGPRDSQTQMAQILGRLLRDFPGKKKVVLDIVARPDHFNGQEGYEQFYKMMCMSMLLDWAIDPPKLNLPPDVDVEEVATNIGRRVMADPEGAQKDPESAVREAFRQLNVSPSEENVRAGTSKVQGHMTRLIKSAIEDLELPIRADTSAVDIVSFHLTGRWLKDLKAEASFGLTLTEKQALKVIMRFVASHKTWPRKSTKAAVPGHPDVTWFKFDLYLRMQFGKDLSSMHAEYRRLSREVRA